MSRIIISSDSNSLNKFLNRDKDKYFYVQVDYSSARTRDILEEKKCKRVDIEKGLNGIDFRKEYIDFIGRLNCSHNSIYWWANSISYKGIFVLDLFHEVYYYYCLISLIRAHKGNFIIISSDSLLNECVNKYCSEKGVGCVVLDKTKRNNKIAHLRRYFLSSLYLVFNGWKCKISISLELSKKIKKLLKQDTPYHVIKSWIDKRSFSDSGFYRDMFFGILPEYLNQKKKDFIVLVGTLTNYKHLIKKIKSIEGFLLLPQEYFAGYFDYIKVAFLTFVKRPKLTRRIMFRDVEVTDLIKRCLDKDYENGEIANNLLYYYYIKGLLKKIKVRSFIYIFENKAWERMSVLAFRRYSPSTIMTGYVHSSIRESYLGYFQSNEEKNIVPSPDKILTTGKEPMLMLTRTGNFSDKVKFAEGCALRYEYILKNNGAQRKKDGGILVTFSIDFAYSLKLLEFLNGAFSEKKYKILLRSHPFMPIETIIEKCSLGLNHNFQISKNSELEQDLKDTSLLLYIDTTSSMEALAKGIPVVHIDFKGPSNRDPLFKLNNLKWTTSDKDELRKVVDYIYNMDDEEYLKRYKDAMDYLNRYFYPVEERYLREFII